MNADRLLTLYDRGAEAPDAIARLRRFVLDLAVRGKLVEQDPADKPEPELLKRVAKQPSAQGDIPPNWCRAEVGKLLDLRYGKGLKATERLDDGPVPVFGSNGIVGYSDAALTDKPAIIIGRKGSAGALNICDGPSWTTDVAYYVEAPSFFVLHFLFIAMSALDLHTLGKGVKPGLSRNDVYELSINVPPLAEQRRIVAKVDELMALCDRLETTRTTREATRDRLAAASLARLTVPRTDPDSFRTHARFALDVLPALTTRPDQIKTLRQTILNLAVRGKLVEPDPSDEPASELLRYIAAEKVRLVKAGAVKKQKPVRHASAEDVPFEVPTGWHPTLLGAVIDLLSGQHLQPSEYSEDPASGIPYITGPSDFSETGLSISRYALVSKAVAQSGQLLLTVKGSGVGKTAICDLPEVAISRQLMALTPIRWDIGFLRLVMHRLAERLQEQARSLIPGISREDVKAFAFHLPPLAEQRRIVAKVDALMALCDRLEKSLHEVDTTRHRLLEALLHEALHEALPAVAEVLEAAG